MSSTDIEAIITDAEAEVEDMVEAQGGTASATSPLLKAAVKALVKAELMERQIFDGTQVKSLPGGPTFESLSLQELRDAAQRKVDTFIVHSGGVYESSSVSIDETIIRRDNKMPDGHLDQSKVKEYHDRADEVYSEDSDFSEV